MKPIRILVVDDHPLVREGIVHLAEAEEDMEVCAEAGSVEEALRVIPELQPGLVLADMSLPGRNGLELIKDMMALGLNIPVLIISMHDEALYGERVLRAGGRGYVMKEVASSILVTAIREVLKGNLYVSPALNNSIVGSLTLPRKEAGSSLRRLTDRELEVFELIGRGIPAEIIATRLRISIRTVDAHRTNIRRKMGLADSSALLRYAVRWFETGAEPPLS